MLLNNDLWAHPKIVDLTDRQAWLFVKVFGDSSMWGRQTVSPGRFRFLGVSEDDVLRFAEVGLGRFNDDGGLTWTCADIAMFSPHQTTPMPPKPVGREGLGFTYLIRAGEHGDVKIGSTYADPAQRLRALQTGSSEPLRLVQVLEGAHLERELHARYERFRTRGEWFDARILDEVL